MSLGQWGKEQNPTHSPSWHVMLQMFPVPEHSHVMPPGLGLEYPFTVMSACQRPYDSALLEPRGLTWPTSVCPAARYRA